MTLLTRVKSLFYTRFINSSINLLFIIWIDYNDVSICQCCFKESKGEMWERYKGTALLRGYALSTLWVVTVPSFIVVVDTLNASIYISIAQGFGIALIGTIIGVFFVSSAERRQNLDITSVLQKEINTVLVNASHNKEERKQKVI